MQDILTCAMGLDIHRDVIVACLAKGELGTDPEIEIRSFSTLIPEMRKLRDWVLEAECRYVAMERYKLRFPEMTHPTSQSILFRYGLPLLM